MMRVVLDTNIVVSGVFWGGEPRRLLALARREAVQLMASEMMLDELLDVVSRPKFVARMNAIGTTPEDILTGYRSLLTVIEPAEIKPVIIDDPDDDVLIACAVACNADYIISGDHHLLELGQYQTSKVVTLRQFFDDVYEA
jgi:putative PIN family toxin of toxin-antitoxin system